MRVKIGKHTLYVYIAVIAFVAGSSAYIKSFTLFGLLINAVEVFVLAECLYESFKEKKVDKYATIVMLFYALLLISTIRGSGEYTALIVYTVQGIGATMFMRSEIRKNPKRVIRVLRNVLFIAILFNFISIFTIEAKVSTTYYFLGYRIAFTPFIISSVFYALLCDCLENRKKMSYISIFSILIGLLTLAIQNISTGLVTLFIVLVLATIEKRIHLINMKTFLLVYTVLFIAVVVFDIQYYIPFLSYFLVNVLGKDLTFDNRTTIWWAAVLQFLRNPVWGQGASGGGLVVVDFEYQTKILNAHNQILNLLCEGGMLSFGAFSSMILFFTKIIDRFQKYYIDRLIMCSIIGFFIIMFTEVQMTKALIFLVFATAASTEEFSKVCVG